MSALRSMLSALLSGAGPDSTTASNQLRNKVDHVATLAIAVFAVAITIGYQVMRHMPESWRQWLLGDSPPSE